MARGKPMTMEELMISTIELLLTISGTIERIDVVKCRTLKWLREHPDVLRGWLQKLNQKLAHESMASSATPSKRADSHVSNADRVQTAEGESSTRSKAMTVKEFMLGTMDLLLNVSGKMGIEVGPQFGTPGWLVLQHPDVLRGWLRKLNGELASEATATDFSESAYSLWPPEPRSAAGVSKRKHGVQVEESAGASSKKQKISGRGS